MGVPTRKNRNCIFTSIYIMGSAGSFYFYEVITIDAALTLSMLRSVGAFFVYKGVIRFTYIWTTMR